ncbi:uncharacterized protein EV420DRAFT_631831 [Desarmillaria tabescens]|uniref:MFS general substrate transporter n=1 Tax=Armillaria tabescens TaxID=1929756 RepID=A0AA39K3Z7_ARMTA|nr:uncharacterized protein EV420DRAFT_631831 [Desarmillaria tabescens]KAK0452936.1 hypothetical protein EV420DRAFT_631831 [Desarmillaria tabescens]
MSMQESGDSTPAQGTATETSPLLPRNEVNGTSSDNRRWDLCKLFLVAAVYFLHRGMYDRFVSVSFILSKDINEHWYLWKYRQTLRVLLSLLTIGWWSHLADVWGRKPIMLISLTGTTLSYLLFIALPQAKLPPDPRVYVGIVALDCLFGGNIAFSGLLYTYIGDCTSPNSRFMLFSALKGLSLFFYAAVAGFVIVLLPAGQIFFILWMMISSVVALLNIVLIIWLLPETLQSPDQQLPILKVMISPVVVFLQQPWLTLTLFAYAMTPNFEIIKMRFGILCSEGPFFYWWYSIFAFVASVFALLFLYPAILILYQRKPRPLQAVLRFNRRLAYTCLSLDVFSTVTVFSIANSNRIAHLVFAAISPFTVAITPAIYSLVPSYSAVLFGSFSVIEALGGMFSNMFVQSFLTGATPTSLIIVVSTEPWQYASF